MRPAEVSFMGDWGAAAVFFCAAAMLGRSVSISPLDPSDAQPDAEILPILGAAGSSWAYRGRVCHFGGALQRGIDADLSGCPDLGPVLAATAAGAPGVSELRGLRTLPHKESDRLEGMSRLVAWAGGRAESLPGPGLRIIPAAGRPPRPGCGGSDAPFDPMGDHRMAFAAALSGLRRGGAVLGPACVSKSFPAFWAEWAKTFGQAVPRSSVRM